MRKSKITLKLNKPVIIGMCIWKLSKVLTYELYSDYTKNKYDKKIKTIIHRH